MPPPEETETAHLQVEPNPVSTASGQDTQQTPHLDPTLAPPKETKAPAESSKAAQSFSLGEGFPSVPPKMVAKILRWDFVDMAELLQDIIELNRKAASTVLTLT